MNTDILWKGKVSNVKTNHGEKNGREWNSTSFILEKNGKEKWVVDSWEKLEIEDGKWYVLGIDLTRQKDKNGEFRTKLLCRFAEACFEEEQEEDYDTPTVGGEDDDNIPF